MSIFQSIFLGIVQGFTEFLPISSSGHLIFLPHLFQWPDQGLAFDVIVHLGSLVAVLVYFRKDLLLMLRYIFAPQHIKQDQKEDKGLISANFQGRALAVAIVVSIIPAGVVGLLFADWIEVHLRSPQIIAGTLFFWGVMLYLVDYVAQKYEEKEMSVAKGLWIGVAQALALIPGTSRSGITMTAGRALGLSRDHAARFSFLMSIPIIALAGGLKLIDFITEPVHSISAIVLFVGWLSAAVSGFIAIDLCLKIIKRWGFLPFAMYRIVVAAGIFFFF